jgi:hydroxymethylbilane synthase
VSGAPRELRIGTRGSQLALWQANTVAARLAETGAPPTRLVVIKTTGDQLQDAPLSEVGGKRLFVKEIEDALLRGEIDLAVHSSKDMSAVLPAGLAIAGVLPREDPHDAVVLPALCPVPSALEDVVTLLGNGASIGTGSIRRISQLSRIFRAAHFAPIRGNLDTRLRKLDSGQYDALVLAAAGLRRLGFASRISLIVPATTCVPAPGQGIVAIEVREDDTKVRDIVATISDANTAVALDAERALVETLGGGCQTPIGALATILPAAAGGPEENEENEANDAKRGSLELVAAVATRDGKRLIRASAHGFPSKAAALGVRVGRDLIAQGADAILAEVRVP